MWVLVSQKNPDVTYALCPGEVYEVGRGNVSILARDDQSVSRVHGKFRVENKPEISRYKSQVFYEELGSTYGSYVGDAAIASSQCQDSSTGEPSQRDRLKKGESAVLPVNTKIRIGLFSTLFKLEWRPMVVSCSTLASREKTTIRETLTKVGGNLLTKENKLVDDWKDEVSHLVMNQVTLTLKVANALAKGIPIVTPAFLSDFLLCQTSKQILPNPNQYIPPLGENTINANDVTLAVKKERQQLFKGRFFAFATHSQMSKFDQCITYAGGQSAVFGIPDSRFRDPNIFKIANNLLIQPEKQSDVLFSTPALKDQGKLWCQAEAIVTANNFKMIPVSAIGLALLNCSVRVHCNPDKQCLLERKSSNNSQKSVEQNKIDKSKEADILAPETQLLTPMRTQKTNASVLIPMETMESLSTDSQTRCIPETYFSSTASRKPTQPNSNVNKDDDVFAKPKAKEIWSDFGNTSSITAVETSRVVRSKTLMASTQVDSSQTAVPQEMSFATSTQNLSPTQQSNIGSMLPPAISLAKSSFWDADESDDDVENDLFAFHDDDLDKKRKRQATPTDDNNASKRACISDVAKNNCNVTTDTLKLDASDKTLGKASSPKSDISLYSNSSKIDTTKVDFSNQTRANPTKKRQRSEEKEEAAKKLKGFVDQNEDQFVEEEDLFGDQDQATDADLEVSAKSHKKGSNKLAKTTTNKPEASVQNGNGSKISLNDDVTIVDEFGFIGKSSFHVKKEDSKSYVVDEEFSRNYANIRTVSLVLEKSLRDLQIQNKNKDLRLKNDNSNNSTNTTNNNVKKFRKQPIPDSHRHPLTCRIITIDDNVDQTFSTNGHSDQTVIGQNKLDDWVIRERQIEAETKESEDLWALSLTQQIQKPSTSKRGFWK